MPENDFGLVNPSRLGQILDRRRIQLDLTYQQVADELGMTVSAVHNLMKGKHTYPVAVLDRVAKALKWTILHLAIEAFLPDSGESPAMREIGSVLAKAKDRRNRSNKAKL